MSGTQIIQGASLGNVGTLDNQGNLMVWFMNGASIASTATYGNVGTTVSVQSLNAD